MISLLTFLLILHFIMLYKTEQVVGEKPEIIDSYEKLLNHPDTMPYFFDGLYSDSDEFKFAPPESQKGKIWKRLISKAGKNYTYYTNGRFDSVNIFNVPKAANEIVQLKAVLISGSYQTSFLCSTFACTLSGEDELWKTVVNADPSEGEDLSGWAVRDSFELFGTVKSYLRRISESGTMVEYLVKQSVEFGYYLMGASHSHTIQQRKICRGYVRTFSETNDKLAILDPNYFQLSI